jgi:hypothetical protein
MKKLIVAITPITIFLIAFFSFEEIDVVGKPQQFVLPEKSEAKPDFELVQKKNQKSKVQEEKKQLIPEQSRPEFIKKLLSNREQTKRLEDTLIRIKNEKFGINISEFKGRLEKGFRFQNKKWHTLVMYDHEYLSKYGEDADPIYSKNDLVFLEALRIRNFHFGNASFELDDEAFSLIAKHGKKLEGFAVTFPTKTDGLVNRIVEYLPGLKKLELTHQYTNDDFQRIDELKSLKELDISKNKKITNEGIESLKKMTHLEKLDIHESGIMAQGIRELREALPNTEIIFFLTNYTHKRYIVGYLKKLGFYEDEAEEIVTQKLEREKEAASK